ncbi:intraflagellar transport protein 52 homolog [Bolinopsis microptera]|uniref:intraflagellar transport protein 52 homolog n=1 Tax=Bolinopsis microptera TaxID=2820187 RepID=UPI003079FBDC
MMDSNRGKTVLISSTKGEQFHMNAGLKSMSRRLRSSWKVQPLKDDLTENSLSSAQLLIFIGPREKFTKTEFDAVNGFVRNGGSLLLSLGDGGEGKYDTNINFLLEDYGIMVNSDSVVRTSYYKYFHPKEALIANGVLNREINKAGGKFVPGVSDYDNESTLGQCLTYVYPYGATLHVVKPSVPVLSTGSTSLPINRPVCAFHQTQSGGKLCVLGSSHIFSDQFIDKEENGKVFDVIIDYLTSEKVNLNSIDAEDPEISDYQFLPDTPKLADRLKACLQEGDEIPRDFTKIFEHSLYKLDNALVPKVIRSYEVLEMKHEPLSLIQPNFETPLPPLQPGVFPPVFKELPGPALDLFDLDEQFASSKTKLAQITNKCGDDDLEYYIRECGGILGITNDSSGPRDAKHILEHIFFQLVEYKKVNQETA